MFVQYPSTWTTNIAFVLLVIFFLRSLISMFRVDISTSTNLGFNPDCIIGHNDVDQHIAGIKTSSSFFNLFFLKIHYF